MCACLLLDPIQLRRLTTVSKDNTFQDLLQWRKTADNTERYV